MRQRSPNAHTQTEQAELSVERFLFCCLQLLSRAVGSPCLLRFSVRASRLALPLFLSSSFCRCVLNADSPSSRLPLSIPVPTRLAALCRGYTPCPRSRFELTEPKIPTPSDSGGANISLTVSIISGRQCTYLRRHPEDSEALLNWAAPHCRLLPCVQAGTLSLPTHLK